MITTIITDIEGTTSAIDFVHKVLFPYASDRIDDYVMGNADSAAVAGILDAVSEQAALPRGDIKALCRQLQDWAAADTKIAPLKNLQGLIWEQGYRQGDYRAHVYADAAERLKQWHDAGLALYVYSSGSVFAQQLFFEHSEFGDLRYLFRDYFDTGVGHKRDVVSYQTICQRIDCAPEQALFPSDIVEELDAAAQAGVATVWLQREADETSQPGLKQVEPHQSVRDFYQIRF